MTSTPTRTYSDDGVNAVAQLTRDSVKLGEVQPGLYIRQDGHVIDVRDQVERGEDHPRRTTGSHTVIDVPSFAAYLDKHGLRETELWGDQNAGTIRAVINAHQGVYDDDEGGEPYARAAGWGDHAITLKLRHTEDWKDWKDRDRKYLPQSEFAEFVEDHLHNFATPSSAEMLELAQTFEAKTKAEFKSSQRLKSGETTLVYAEDTQASAGAKGSIAIPDYFIVGVRVYEGAAPYSVKARFRYRIREGQLALGYRIDRVDDVLRAAFDETVGKVEAETNRTIWRV